MGFLFKLFFFLLVIGIGGGFLINRLPAVRQKVIETVNPAAKENRLLAELGSVLSELDQNLGMVAGARDAKIAKSTVQTGRALISRSQNILQDVAKLREENSGLLKTGLAKLIEVFSDQTPYPADHLQTDQLTPQPPVIVCPSPR